MKPSTPTPSSRYKTPKPPVVGTEQVVCKCGHAVAFELFPPAQDRFRADRRKKLTDRACSACRQQAAAEQIAKDQAAKAERKKANAASKPAKREPSGKPAPGRLPDGSTFAVSYDAEAQRWSGTLTIPGSGEEMQTYKGEASGVFKLLERLDGMYRQTAGDTAKAAGAQAGQAGAAPE